MSGELTEVEQVATPAPVCYVEVIGGEKDGLHFEIGSEGLLVGRSATCDVLFDSREVSRRHAYFYTDDNACFVEDLGSKNGVWVNGLRAKKQALDDGDTVDTGPVRFVLHVGDRARMHESWLSAATRRTKSSEGADGPRAQSPFRYTLAVASVVFAVLSHVHWAFGAGAVVLAMLAFAEMRREAETAALPLIVAGMAVGLVGGGMNIWFAHVAPRMRARAAAVDRSACRENVSQIAVALTRYRLEHDGEFPETLNDLASEGLIDAGQLHCPGCVGPTAASSRYLYAPPAPGGTGDAHDVLACDASPDWHGGLGGWVLRRDGSVSWEPRERLLRVLEQMGARRPGPLTSDGGE